MAPCARYRGTASCSSRASCAVPAVLLLLLAGQLVDAAQHAGSRRRLLIRPLPNGAGTCKNTYQGPWLMADDKGKVCATKDLDFYTGCCKEGQQHACDKCGKEDSCCESFEHCVSCCMAPDNKPEEKRQQYPRVPNKKEGGGVWDTVFQYCMAICRTHVFSTSHENAYIGARHHCFSKLGKPLLSPPLAPGALEGVSVVLSAAGSSCASMCEQQGLSCSAQHLHLLNSCDRLREVTNCEAGCVEEEHADHLPAAVDGEAPKANRPALCLVSSKGTAAAEGFSCDTSANYMRRLCPCVKGGSSGSSGTAAKSSAAKGEGSSSSEEQQPKGSSKGSSGGAIVEEGAQGAAGAGVAAAADSSSSKPSGTGGAAAAAAAGEPAKAKPDAVAPAAAADDGGEGDLREYEEDPDRGQDAEGQR